MIRGQFFSEMIRALVRKSESQTKSRSYRSRFRVTAWQSPRTLRVPKIEKIQDRRPGLKFSSEIENIKRATQQTPIFVGNSEGQDWKFQSRLNISSEIEIFNRDWIFSIFGPLGNLNRIAQKRNPNRVWALLHRQPPSKPSWIHLRYLGLPGQVWYLKFLL